jgi:predicted lactoylglutathione lyase
LTIFIRPRYKIPAIIGINEKLTILAQPTKMDTEPFFNKIRSYHPISGEAELAWTQDHGWMYVHSFSDLDGHQWEFIYMDQTQLPNQE